MKNRGIRERGSGKAGGGEVLPTNIPTSILWILHPADQSLYWCQRQRLSDGCPRCWFAVTRLLILSALPFCPVGHFLPVDGRMTCLLGLRWTWNWDVLSGSVFAAASCCTTMAGVNKNSTIAAAQRRSREKGGEKTYFFEWRGTNRVHFQTS